MDATYSVVYKDLVMDRPEVSGGRVRGTTLTEIGRKVNQQVNFKRSQLDYQADMDGRYEVESLTVEVKMV